MFRKLFGRSAPPAPDVSGWWSSANDVAKAPSRDAIEALRAQKTDPAIAPDIAEAQDEFLDALDALLTLPARESLPAVPTQHRVIGADTCHYIAPASLGEQLDGGGKVFVTSARLILVAGGVHAWAWHTVVSIVRQERDLTLTVRGRAPVVLRFNSYEHALMVNAMAERLRRPA